MDLILDKKHCNTLHTLLSCRNAETGEDCAVDVWKFFRTRKASIELDIPIFPTLAGQRHMMRCRPGHLLKQTILHPIGQTGTLSNQFLLLEYTIIGTF